jgi:1-acyl-sn-glycerol-3-phosphate acyltransferase
MFFSHLGCIPIDRQRRNSRSLKYGEEILNDGKRLVVFPEGTRSKTGKILPTKFGTASLSKKTNTPIVPVIITGKPKLFRRTVRVQYTEPIKPMNDLKKLNQKLYDRFSAIRSLHQTKDASKIKESNSWLQTILEKPILFLIKTIYRPKLFGTKNVPKTGAMVLAANHKHVFDQFLPELALHKGQQPVYFGKIEYSYHPFWRIMKHFNVVFVDRQAKDKSMSIQYTNEKIQKGDSLIIFPEGTRNKTSKILKSFKFGAVSFAFHNRVPLIPVAIVGVWKPFDKNLEVHFGKPITVKSKADYANANKKLYNSIEKMLINGGEKAYRKEIFSTLSRKDSK